MHASKPGSGLPRPRKKPTQPRAVFTVQAIYDGFVRIWRRDGPAAATTRAIAAETGYSVGTIYDYFPNRTALLAGYYEHCIDRLCEQLVAADTDSADRPWPARLRLLVQRLYGQSSDSPYFDREMLTRESLVANPGRQQHAFEKCSACVYELIQGWPDRPGAVSRRHVDTLVQTVWGSMRYAHILGRDTLAADAHVEDLTLMARALLLSAAEDQPDKG
ncbi:TetR/AcrR family transcriptional regulator [Salinisphaera sp.]|uniref:TetR/AcrR family transcriptional regulator n=1 Tax=Salinisphaera sp. TaxID=1914330 RepID=UPI000C36688B|nr:TetR/AcrR family transcriptional regulator [Salinisphaera sp.]MBS62315.1 TetR family transcriptional regulator [Salinisphaera sp.]